MQPSDDISGEVQDDYLKISLGDKEYFFGRIRKANIPDIVFFLEKNKSNHNIPKQDYQEAAYNLLLIAEAAIALKHKITEGELVRAKHWLLESMVFDKVYDLYGYSGPVPNLESELKILKELIEQTKQIY